MNVYEVIVDGEVIELVTETEQDARIIAAHCCRKMVKRISKVTCLIENYTGEPYFKTRTNED